jgi:hypothetical protein
MSPRKIIFKCKVGSYLYGTNHSESDEDFYGVFLPSTEDLLSIQKCPEELVDNVKNSDGPRNTFGDTDCKYFSLQKFLKLAAEGQPGQLEMLFAPKSSILIETEEWKEIKENKSLFLSKNSISPFLGFALSQAHRAMIKGENLTLIRTIIEWGSTLNPEKLNLKLRDHFLVGDKGFAVFNNLMEIKYYTNNFGFPQLSVAGRDFDAGTKTRNFIDSMKTLESKYGTRVQSAAENKYDYKSLGHAVRLLGQAEEFLTKGTITLPRPDAEYLKTILRGSIDDSSIDWFDLLNKRIDSIKQEAILKCAHPEKPDMLKINMLCTKLLRNHLNQ